MRKLLISALVAAMVLGVGATALAASPTIQAPAFSDIAGNDAESALALLAALGIYSGDSGLGGAVHPDDPITRAQFCKVVVTAMGRGNTAAGLSGLQPTFTDVASIPSWAWGYVNVAVYMGIINGYPDGSFGADNPVTYGEAVTMLIRAVSGHAAQVPAGVWPYNYLFYGVDSGFTGGVDVGFANLPATRGDVARMVFATMQVDKLDGDGAVKADSSVLYDRIFYGTLTDYDDATNGTVTLWKSYRSFDYDLGDEVVLAGGESLDAFRNLSVMVVLDAPYGEAMPGLMPGAPFTGSGDGKAVFLGTAEETGVYTGVYKTTIEPESQGDAYTLVLADGTEFPFDGFAVTLNNDLAHSDADLAAGDEVTVYTDESGYVSHVIAFREDLGPDYIETVTPSTDEDDTALTFGSLGGLEIPAAASVTVNGAAADRDELEADDVVYIASFGADTNEVISVRAIRDTVEGTVDGTTTSYTSGGTVEKVTIDGETYTVADDGAVLALPVKGDKVKYALDAEGSLFVEIGYEALTPFVVVRSFTLNGDGTATATVDMRGTEVTYKVADSYIEVDGVPGRSDGDIFLYNALAYYAEHGDPAWIQVDQATGTIVDVAAIIGPDGFWSVVGASGDGSLTLGDDPDSPTTFDFIPADAGITVYELEETTSNWIYIATQDITANDEYLLLSEGFTNSFGFDGEADTPPAHMFWIWIPADEVA